MEVLPSFQTKHKRFIRMIQEINDLGTSVNGYNNLQMQNTIKKTIKYFDKHLINFIKRIVRKKIQETLTKARS